MTAVILLPLTLSAQELAANQQLMGHYTTNDVNVGTGWGMPALSGTLPLATDLNSDELAPFRGSKIIAFRIGLAQSTPVTRVFVIPVDANGNLGEMTEWPCDVSSEGWNTVYLDTPYLIDLPVDASLRIGFDYSQTKTNRPISAVKVGKTYVTYCQVDGAWADKGISVYGNLSLQCIVEGDEPSPYIIRTRQLQSTTHVKIGDDVAFQFEVSNLGTTPVAAGECAFDISIDGNHVATMSNDAPLSNAYTTLYGTVTSAGLAIGPHTLTVTPVSINGAPLDDVTSAQTQFTAFDKLFTRQMHLIEQFTSTSCTYCPRGTTNVQALCHMRDDIAWVCIHQNQSSIDPYTTSQCDSIADMQNVGGYPKGSFDRTVGIASASEVIATLTNLSPSLMDSFLEYIDQAPAWATVNVNSTYNNDTRQATITIDGELVTDYTLYMGQDSRLTVYITEDGLVSPQLNSGTWVSNYVHNGVLRQAIGSVKGVALNSNGDTYKNTFTVNIPDSWNADKLNIIAFISRPLGNNLTDIYVTNANKRKLGEHDEPAWVRGDANGDGKVTIDDVTVLIDALLAGTEPISAGGDCDQNGRISIDDVTMIIDYLLSGTWND